VRDLIVGLLATVYGLWLCYAAKLEDLLLTSILFAPATLIYIAARRERGQRAFTRPEIVIALAVTAVALFAVYQLVTGAIQV
jgi:arginine:ornithine antiporter/lysine permease